MPCASFAYILPSEALLNRGVAYESSLCPVNFSIQGMHIKIHWTETGLTNQLQYVISPKMCLKLRTMLIFHASVEFRIMKKPALKQNFHDFV